MPKTLYLLRHAESGEKQIGQSDKDRELTANGIREAFQVGTFLHKKGIVFDAYISSSATRAVTTTQLVSDAMRAGSDKIIHEDQLYEASARIFFDVLMKLDNSLNNVMFIGHNPTISHVAEYLTKADLSQMATCGLSIIQFKVNSWASAGEKSGDLVNYISPSTISVE